MVIKFNDIGSSLGTRATGRQIRERIEAAIQSGERVAFDFQGVNVVSNSFADETFAKLLLKFDMPFVKAHTTFKDANPFIQQSISFAFRQRLAQLTY